MASEGLHYQNPKLQPLRRQYLRQGHVPVLQGATPTSKGMLETFGRERLYDLRSKAAWQISKVPKLSAKYMLKEKIPYMLGMQATER